MKRKTTKPTTPTTPKASAKDATAEKVLNLLLAKLQAGVNAWKKPWDSKGNPTADPRFFAVNLFTGKPYSGINCSTLEAGFYAGFSQITANGGKVKKGSNAYPVVWFGSFEKDLDEAQQQEIWNVFDVNESKPSSGKYGPCYRFAPNFYEVYNVYLTEDCDLEKVTKVCKVLKTENVFSIEDTEGLENFVEKFWAQFKGEEKSKIFNANENGDLWIDAYCIGAKLGGFHHNGGNRSYYAPVTDSIHLAKKTAYHSPAEYYSTAFHEMTHSSGAASRLNRDGIVKFDRFGSPRYAKEELIAEMGAAMAMGFLGIDTEGTNDNSAAYLGNWLHQKIGEKASEEALKTLMAASSSAKFAFAYIAEFYEAAKAAKEEENKQKKQEEPAPLPMLPAVIAPTATAAAAVFKAEPSERATLTDEAVCTPRGTFRIATESKTELEAKGYGLWFEWTTPRLGEKYFIMHHYPTQTAVAVKTVQKQRQRYMLLEYPNAVMLYDTKSDKVLWKIYLDTCEEVDGIGLEEWNSLPEDIKEQVKKTASEIRHKKFALLNNNPIIAPKSPENEEEMFKYAVEQKDMVVTQSGNSRIMYSLVSFLKRFNIIDRKTLKVCYRLMPNGEPCGVLPEAGQDARAEALSEFWVNIEDSTAVRVSEGDGTNLSDEDVEAGYVDYIYYDTFEACDGLNIAERAENDDNSDGGMILLKKPYKSYTTLEIASKVVNFIYGMMGSHEPDWKWSEDAPKFEEPDPEHYNDGMIDLRNIQEFCRIVFTNCDGDTKVVGYDDNFFAPCDLLEAYKSLWRKDWNMDDEKELYIKKFKEYLIATGCSAEELEDND